jgi:3-dehydroquinate synthase
MLLHGEAVAIDMALSTELAWGRGLLSDEQRGRMLGLLRALSLPLWHDCCSVKLFMKVRSTAALLIAFMLVAIV